MRTTIDLPDPLFRQVKSTAAVRGLKLKEFIAEALSEALKPAKTSEPSSLTPEEVHRMSMEAHLRAMRKDRIQTAPVGHFNREELYDRND